MTELEAAIRAYGKACFRTASASEMDEKLRAALEAARATAEQSKPVAMPQESRDEEGYLKHGVVADLRKFLNAAGGEGFVLDGIDGGSLYMSIFNFEDKVDQRFALAAMGSADANSVRDAATREIWMAEVCQDEDGFKHIESVVEDLDDFAAGTRLYVLDGSKKHDLIDDDLIAKLALEVSTECLAVPGVNFYMAAEMAIELTIETLGALTSQQDAASEFKPAEQIWPAPTEAMRHAMEDETPYFCRRAIDKSCYEVGIRNNEDWRECISDDQTILATYRACDDANEHYDSLEFEWRYAQMIAAIESQRSGGEGS